MFEAVLDTKEASRKTREFVEEHMREFWEIFKPLAPYIMILTAIDVMVTELFMPIDDRTGNPIDFGLGGLVAAYFQTCLVVSWHRVVLHGPDQYVAMNPFKPTKDELKFVGVIVGLFVGLMVIAGSVMALTLVALGQIAAVIVAFIVVLALLNIGLKVSFYFPARATGNHITLKQSYRMTDGYIWKILVVSFFAPLRLIGLTILYAIIGMILVFAIAFLLPLGSIGTIILGVLYSAPIVLYFGPLLTVIGVTVLSNYYQHALQNNAASDSSVMV